MITMKYLFWNTYRNEQINSVLCDLIFENGISIVVLAEYTADIKDLIKLLNTCGISMQQVITTGCERIHILRRAGIHIEPKQQTDRASIQVIEDNTILCGVHLNSQIYSDNAERREIDIEQIVAEKLEEVRSGMYEKALANREKKTYSCTSIEEIKAAMKQQGYNVI